MYRVLSTQRCDIYCEESFCNQKCGLFHREDVKQKKKGRSLRDRRAKQFRVQSLDIAKDDLNGDKRSLLSVNSDGQYHQVSYLNIQEPNAIDPITPLSSSSVVTLDDIICSAKRKISNHDNVDLRISSPDFVDASDTEGLHPLAQQRNLIGGTPWPKDVYHSDESSHKEDSSFVDHLVNSSDDDDDHWVEYDPPSIIEDGEQEDFDELLKSTKAPIDHYSNPLYKNADKLTKMKRKKSDFDDASSASLSIADISISDYDLNFALLQTRLNDVNEKVQYEGNL